MLPRQNRGMDLEPRPTHKVSSRTWRTTYSEALVDGIGEDLVDDEVEYLLIGVAGAAKVDRVECRAASMNPITATTNGR